MTTSTRYPNGIWGVDFEFHPLAGQEGNPPVPVCMVARNFRNDETLRLWQDELAERDSAPFPTDDTALVVAFYASAEASCFEVLGWPRPTHLLDLFTAFRIETNGLPVPAGNGLVGALSWFGLHSMGSERKHEMRELVLRGGPWADGERLAILDYCASDVFALQKLFTALEPTLDWPRVLLQSQYSVAAASIELAGVPIDTLAFNHMQANRQLLQEQLILRLDAEFQVYDGTTFKQERFAHYLARNSMHWPRLASGSLDLSNDTFKDMCRVYPHLEPLRQTRKFLSASRNCALQVGEDGRNRCMLSMYRSKTGRNQPSNSKSIFGLPSWMRGFIQPCPGYALAYIDWCQQEFGIAAALSKDSAMLEAYESGDPYLAFAKQAGAAPADSTKHSHKQVRDQFKACVLAVQYGMAEESLAHRIGQPIARARQLLQLHRATYHHFWRWTEGILNQATLGKKLWTAFGWTLHVTENSNARSLCNFPMQANGAEMMRLACIKLVRDGIKVCAPVHDAILIEAPEAEIDLAVLQTQQVMAAASSAVLNGFELTTDVKLIRHPDRFLEDRGIQMWNLVVDILEMQHMRVLDA